MNVLQKKSPLDTATLVSFRICPFVVRAQIVAHENNIDLKTEYIDLNHKPDWFLKISPTGTVPGLILENAFIFESAVIAEFIDELTDGYLFPEDAVQRYLTKSWTSYASTLIQHQYGQMIAPDKTRFTQSRSKLAGAMQKIEVTVKSNPFYNGKEFHIIDAAYAPVLYRLLLMKEKFGDALVDDFPTIKNWANSVCNRPSVKVYLNEEFDAALMVHLKEKQSWLLTGD